MNILTKALVDKFNDWLGRKPVDNVGMCSVYLIHILSSWRGCFIF